VKPHLYKSVQGWCSFEKLYASEVARARDGAMFVEVGSWLGRSSVFMGEEIKASGKQIYLHCVDTFEGTGADYGLYPVVRDGKQYKTFLKNIEPVRNIIVPHKQTSAEFAATVNSESTDFVFLDAGHTYADVMADILAWWPKVKPGCHLAGHDYHYAFGVKKAVDEFCEQAKLNAVIDDQQDCWIIEKPL
jgi:cephalosporin hydroxylase